MAGYLGQTAMKTAEVVEPPLGGVLFIDEAYSLAGDQYGQEAIDTLVKEMEDHRDDLVVIVAGYPRADGRLHRARTPAWRAGSAPTINFDDYTDDELVADLRGDGQAARVRRRRARCLDRLRELLGAGAARPTFGNARYVRNVLEAAIGRHAWRLREVDEPTLEQLRELTPDDLDTGRSDEPGSEPTPSRVEWESTPDGPRRRRPRRQP